MREHGWWSKTTRSLAYALEAVDNPNRPHIPVPAWNFDERQHANGPAHFLLAVSPDSTFPSIDGAHDDPEGVAKTRKLYGSIGLITPPKATRYLMLMVQAGPASGGEVNQDAIDTLNRIAPRG